MKAALPDTPTAVGFLSAVATYAAALYVTPALHTLHVLSPCKTVGYIRCGVHLLGTLWGIYLTFCMAGVALGGLFMAAPAASGTIRVMAGLHLLWLAWRWWRGVESPAVRVLPPLRLGQAVLWQLGNAKTWLLAVWLIAGFVSPGDRYLENLLTAGGLFCLVLLPALLLWATQGRVLLHGKQVHPPLQRGVAAVAAAMALLIWT